MAAQGGAACDGVAGGRVTGYRTSWATPPAGVENPGGCEGSLELPVKTSAGLPGAQTSG